jgi:hypothetical protein
MRGLALGLTVVLLAGCSLGGDGEDATIAQAELNGLVLQPDDLPATFIQFDEGRQGIADRPTGERSDPARFGRLDGWKSRYRRPGGSETEGPLVIESRAAVFKSNGGASDELDAFEQPGFAAVEEPEVGDEARAWESVQSVAAGGAAYYVIAWREDNATASLLVSGFEGKLSFDEALELARKQAARLSRAAG